MFLRLCEGLGRDGPVPPSEIPVMFEDADSHIPGGGTVLYMDGHVEFVRFPGKFPMTPEFLEAVREAAGKPASHLYGPWAWCLNEIREAG